MDVLHSTEHPERHQGSILPEEALSGLPRASGDGEAPADEDPWAGDADTDEEDAADEKDEEGEDDWDDDDWDDDEWDDGDEASEETENEVEEEDDDWDDEPRLESRFRALTDDEKDERIRRRPTVDLTPKRSIKSHPPRGGVRRDATPRRDDEPPD